MITLGLMSSNTEEWATPQTLFDELNAEFSFELDVCATGKNAKCQKFFTKDTDALTQEWRGTCYMNPPYGRTIGKWLRKAKETADLGLGTVVALVPARTDTAWWHDYAAKGEVRFLRGRVKFVDIHGTGNKPAPFPSAVVVFRKAK